MPRPNKMKGAPQKVKNPFKTFKRIVSYMGVYKFYLILVLVLILLGSLANVAGTYFLKPLINDYIIPFVGQKNPDLSGFIKALLIMGSIYLVGVISTYVYNKLMVKISTGTLYRIRKDMFFHMQKLPVKYFDTHTHGELMSRYTNDTDTLRDMLSQCFAQFISAAITVIGVFVMMVVLSPALTLLVVAMLVIIILILKFMGKKSGYYFGLQQKEIGKVNGHIEEMIEGQKVVKVFCHEEQAKTDFDKLNSDLCEAAKSANTIGNIIMPIMGNLSYAHYAITAMVGGILSVTTGLDLGTLASFLQYTRSFSQPITQMSQQFNFLIVALAGAERIFDLIDQTPETDEGYVTLINADFDENGNIFETEKRTDIWAWKHPHSDGTLTYTQLKGDVTFNHVVFGYNEKKTVLNDISLFAKPGQKIAFVGSTGAGKTTVTNLINRFYEIDKGSILYDGIDIRNIKKHDLRSTMGIVLQDVNLFEGTIAENIRYGRLDATDEEIVEAAKLANAHYFITNLAKGYDTMLTANGQNLSQGERQLLSIARAAIADPTILILDEATSSVDTRTERLIEEGMNKLMEGRTTFIIAHRLSTVRNSNAIMVLEHGEILERGDHDDLMEQKGRYYDLNIGAVDLE